MVNLVLILVIAMMSWSSLTLETRVSIAFVVLVALTEKYPAKKTQRGH